MKAITSLLVSAVTVLLLACGQSTSQPSQAHPHIAAAAVSHAVPVKLEIRKLGIDATVEQVATDKNGQMGLPSDYHNVAWYAPGVIPGDKGDAVISGHLDWVVNGKLTPAVFTKLGSLNVGDEFQIVGQDSKTLDFKVTDTKLLAYNANPAHLDHLRRNLRPEPAPVHAAPGRHRPTGRQLIRRLLLPPDVPLTPTQESEDAGVKDHPLNLR